MALLAAATMVFGLPAPLLIAGRIATVLATRPLINTSVRMSEYAIGARAARAGYGHALIESLETHPSRLQKRRIAALRALNTH